MDILEEYYGKRNFTLYALFMRVPGSNAFYRRIFVTFSIIVLSFSTIFQVLKFATDGLTLKLIVELMPTIVAVFGSLLYILYLTFASKFQFQFEQIMSLMLNDLKEKRSPEESEIKKRYAADAVIFTNAYTVVLIITVGGMPLAGFLPHFLDVFMSVNDTRDVELLFNGEIFIDQKKSFYYIYFIECCTAVIAGILVIISENIAIIIGQHKCGTTAVLGYQLENLTKINEEELSNVISYEDLLTRRLQMYIKNHQILLRFAVIATEFYDIPLTIILIGCFCAITMGLVQVTDPQLINMKIAIFTCTEFCQLCLMSYMGQIITDASLRVGHYAYFTEWDVCPGNVRKFLQMIILRCSKPCQVTARGIYVLSIENCMAVIQTIMSFYMVFRQSH